MSILRNYLNRIKPQFEKDGKLQPILSNPVLFGVNLYEAGLADKVEALVKEELAGPGAVRATLKKYLA